MWQYGAMPKRSGTKDVNQIAAGIVAKISRSDISALMAEMGRKGGRRGGRARADRMTPEQRSASASKAARARWVKEKGR